MAKAVTVSQAGEVKVIANHEKVPRENFQKALDDGTFKEVMRAIRDGCPITISPAPGTFPVWKRILLGTHKSVDALRRDLKSNGFRISDWGNNILRKISLATSETEINLCVATVKELTGKDWATNREILGAIRAKGYELCPAEVGPQLRLQYPDQPSGEWLRIGMEPITGSDGGLFIFNVDPYGDERWLSSFYGYPGHEWSGDRRFVFVSCK